MSRPLARFAEADPLLVRALELPPADRAAFIATACGDDAELGALLRDLLAAADDERPLAAVDLETERARALAAGGDPLPPGECVGAWRVVSRLGAGGSAVVYAAERAEGDFAQRVALKLLTAASSGFAARFAAERRILARLEHPAIARLVDGGVDARGRSWLAVELVDGQPIDRACDERRLSLRDRALLLAAVGRALDYAHRALVVHRDLKPSNVLIDAGGAPRVLDFGIAKVLDPDLSTGETATLGSPLTPRWGSPEQLAGEPVGVASDVYQLGLLLHQLLVGRLPEARERTTGILALAAAARAPLVAPSMVARSCDAETATRRMLDSPATLARALRGDLDTIVLRALAVEPERRYASARDLAADLEAYAGELPIAAKRDRLGYRLSKLARRHPAATTAVALGIAAVIAYVPSVTFYANHAARERDLARAAYASAETEADFLAGLFTVSDSHNALGEDPRASELVRRGEAVLADELSPRAPERPLLLARLAAIRLRLGDPARATRLAEQAYAATAGSGTLAEAAAAHALGIALETSWLRPRPGQYQRAERLLRRAHEVRARLLGDDNLATLDSLVGVGITLRRQERDAEAATVLDEAIERLRRSSSTATRPRRLVDALHHSARAHLLAGHARIAELLMRECLARGVGIPGGDPMTSLRLNTLGNALKLQGRNEEALAVLRRSLGLKRAKWPPGDPYLATTLLELADLELEAGRLEEAQRLADESLVIRRRAYGEDDPRTSLARLLLARVVAARGDRGRAAELAAEVRVALARRPHAETATALGRLDATLARSPTVRPAAAPPTPQR